MADKRAVRGWLEVISAEAEGVEWELDRDTLRRLKFDASPGPESLVFVMLEKAKKGLGQPKKAPAKTNDVLRAIVLYQTACRIRAVVEAGVDAKIEMPLFKLISLATEVFPTHGLFEKPKGENKMHASVKHGREICDIDKYWRGKPILEIVESLFKSD